MLQLSGQTTNFTVQFEDTIPNSAKRAAAVLSVCESEFSVLMNWFGLASGFGPDNRITVNINQPDTVGASNFGYATDGRSLIQITAQSGNPSDVVAGEIVKMMFVGEFVEILMGLRNKTTGTATWNPGNSDGEGLSQLCENLRFPVGHAAAYTTPWVNTWLQSAARADWFTAPQPTDKVADSFGCALLFLFYLKDQLFHSVPDIIQKGGASLEATYENLTGGSSASNTFKAFLEPYFPTGKTPALATNDPFPLLQSGGRDILLNFSQQTTSKPVVVGIGEANLSPGPICPKKTYQYEIIHTPRRLTCVASGHGFALPVISWRINGVDVPAFGTISPGTSVFVDDPNQPRLGSSSIVLEPMSCSISSTDFSSTLVIDFPELFGHPYLYFEVSAKERFFPGDSNVTVTTGQTVDNAFVAFEAQYYVDRDACEKHFRTLLHRYLRVDWMFNIVHTLPDPPPDLFRAIQQIKEFNVAIEELAEKSPETAEKVLAAATHAIGINREALHAIGTAGVRVRLPAKPTETE
jgi:hypothetical protein